MKSFVVYVALLIVVVVSGCGSEDPGRATSNEEQVIAAQKAFTPVNPSPRKIEDWGAKEIPQRFIDFVLVRKGDTVIIQVSEDLHAASVGLVIKRTGMSDQPVVNDPDVHWGDSVDFPDYGTDYYARAILFYRTMDADGSEYVYPFALSSNSQLVP